MIDPFDAALSAFIDTLPEDASEAQRLLTDAAPFSGQGDLPELAELATMLRAVEPYQPRPEWMAASKARLMTAPVLPPEKRGFTWLGSMFLPLTQLSFPTLSLPKLGLTSPLVARGAMALALIVGLTSVARQRPAQSPIMEVTGNSVQLENAQQAIAAAQAEAQRLQEGQVAGVAIEGSPRDVVLLAKQIDLAELAIEDAPPAAQPALRNQLQSAVKTVRFDGELEGVTNGSTLQVSGVAVQSDPATVKELQVGQPVSLLVTVGGNGKLQAVQVTPLPQQGASSPSAAGSASSATATPSAVAAAPPAPAQGGGTAQTSNASSGSPGGNGSSPLSSPATSGNPNLPAVSGSAGDASQPPQHGRGRQVLHAADSDGGQAVSSPAPAPANPGSGSGQNVVTTVVVSPAPAPPPPANGQGSGDPAPASPSGSTQTSVSTAGAVTDNETAPAPQAGSPGGGAAGAGSPGTSSTSVTSASTGDNQSVTVTSSSHSSTGTSQTVSTSVSSSTSSGGSSSSSHSSTVVSSSSSSGGSSSGASSKVLQVVTSISNVSSSSSSSSGKSNTSSSSSKGRGKDKRN